MAETGRGGLLARLEGYIVTIVRKFASVSVWLIAIMMLVTVVHVVGRYSLALPVPGVVTGSCFALVTMLFLTIAYTHAEKDHVVVTVISDRLSERNQAIINSFTHTLGLAVTVTATWCTFVEGTYLMQMGDTAYEVNLPYFPFYYIVAFGWALFSLILLIDVVHFILRATKK